MALSYVLFNTFVLFWGFVVIGMGLTILKAHREEVFGYKVEMFRTGLRIALVLNYTVVAIVMYVLAVKHGHALQGWEELGYDAHKIVWLGMLGSASILAALILIVLFLWVVALLLQSMLYGARGKSANNAPYYKTALICIYWNFMFLAYALLLPTLYFNRFIIQG